MTPEQLIERVKSLGPEWNHAASKLEDAVRSMETAREHRVAFLERCLTETTQRLAKLKEELRTLPEQIAKWEAEREHLEASTAVGLVMGEAAGRVKCDGDHAGPPCADRECWNRCERCRQTAHDGECGAVVYTAKLPGQVLVNGKPEDPFVPGLPPLRLREVWAEWEDEDDPSRQIVIFKGDTYRWSFWHAKAPDNEIGERQFSGISLRPRGKTWKEVEAMADARERQKHREPAPCTCKPGRQTFLICDGCKDMLPNGLWMQATETPMPARRAAEMEVEKFLADKGRAKPEPPALLNLRTLKVGTVCEATADIQMCRITIHIAKGACFAVVEDHDAQRLPGEASVRVDARDGSWRIPALVPARVVEVPQ